MDAYSLVAEFPLLKIKQKEFWLHIQDVQPEFKSRMHLDKNLQDRMVMCI